MTLYNWKKIPKDVNWIAMDESGEIWGFENEPRRSSELWALNDPGSDSCMLLLSKDFNIIKFVDWKDSLEQRPEWSKLNG